MTLSEVADRTGIGVSSLSEFENAKRQPRLSQLQKLAEFYKVSLSFFFEKEPLAATTVLWRQKPETPVAKDVEAGFLRSCEQFHNLEVWCRDEKPLSLPLAKGEPEAFGYAEAERLAYEVWKALQLGERPGPALLRVLEETCGVKVFHMDFEPTGTAACTQHDRFGAAILLNSGNARWRRNFDLAHELFHLLTWKIFRGVRNGPDAKPADGEEKLATCFAGRLLMPTDVTKQEIAARTKDGRIAFPDLFDIAREFDVSIEALLWRMCFLYPKRTEEVTRKDIDRCRQLAAAWDKRAADAPPRRPGRFEALAIRAFQAGEISLGRFAEYMGISRGEAEQFLEGMPQNGKNENTVAVA